MSVIENGGAGGEDMSFNFSWKNFLYFLYNF